MGTINHLTYETLLSVQSHAKANNRVIRRFRTYNIAMLGPQVTHLLIWALPDFRTFIWCADFERI